MPKVDRHGQGAIISDADYIKIRKEILTQLNGKSYRLLLDIARFTGERWGAIVKLRVEDIWDEGEGNQVRSHINFRAATRKATPDGKRSTRQVPLHPQLKEILEGYPVPKSHWLFESRLCPGQPITLRMADLALRGAIERANLSHRGYCTHSTRRTFITRLWEKGTDLHTIQLLTGHQDPRSLIRYIEADPERIAKALAVL